MGQYESYLKQFDEEYAAAEVVDYAELPDGKYQARIERAAMEPFGQNGDVMLVWEFEIVTGEQMGKTVRKLSTVKPGYLQYIKRDFLRLNIQLEPFSKLEECLPDVLDLVVNIELKHGKPNSEGKSYQNIYINKVVGRAEKQTATQSAVETAKGKAKKTEPAPTYAVDDTFSDLPF